MKRLIRVFALTMCSVAFADSNGPNPSRDRNPLDQGADWCPATVIPGVPYTDTGTTTGRVNDSNPPCAQCCQAEDVIYEYTPALSGTHTISLCGSNFFDSVLELRTGGTCPGSTLVDCNDDFCGVQARLSVDLTAGTTYYIIVDAFFESDGPYTLNVIQQTCAIGCQPFDVIECAETPDSTNFTNDCNGGCRVEPDRFQNISCGQTVCGVGFTYLRSDGSYRDTDWYLFTLAETSLVNVQVFADFEVDIGISRAVDCPFGFFMTGVGDTCETLSVTSQNCLAPGNYILLVEPFWFSGMPTPRPYRVTLNCGPCANCLADVVITAPGTYSSNTCGEGDDCTLDESQQFDIEDRFVRVNIPQPGIWQFSLCSSLEP